MSVWWPAVWWPAVWWPTTEPDSSQRSLSASESQTNKNWTFTSFWRSCRLKQATNAEWDLKLLQPLIRLLQKLNDCSLNKSICETHVNIKTQENSWRSWSQHNQTWDQRDVSETSLFRFWRSTTAKRSHDREMLGCPVIPWDNIQPGRMSLWPNWHESPSDCKLLRLLRAAPWIIRVRVNILSGFFKGHISQILCRKAWMKPERRSFWFKEFSLHFIQSIKTESWKISAFERNHWHVFVTCFFSYNLGWNPGKNPGCSGVKLNLDHPRSSLMMPLWHPCRIIDTSYQDHVSLRSRDPQPSKSRNQDALSTLDSVESAKLWCPGLHEDESPLQQLSQSQMGYITEPSLCLDCSGWILIRMKDAASTLTCARWGSSVGLRALHCGHTRACPHRGCSPLASRQRFTLSGASLRKQRHGRPFTIKASAWSHGGIPPPPPSSLPQSWR